MMKDTIIYKSFGMNSDLLKVQNNKCILATCNLNQWALDFDGNLNRTIDSIKIAKAKGARYRLGPELELSGYSCEDHFLELDTFMHCEQSLAAILDSDVTNGILCDIGCPILHNNVRYNCRVYCLNKQIILIRPKTFLADDGNYRERRYFSSWDINNGILTEHALSDLLRKVTKQTTVPMGIAVLATEETTLASEICEELWTARSPHIELYLSGVEIVTNGSGSHHELRKLDSRIQLMRSATKKCGGVYIYSNQRGGDGGRLYFDGCSLICCNGDVIAQASQFSLQDVEVITAVIDLDNIRSFRGVAASLQEQSSRTPELATIDLRTFSLRPGRATGPLTFHYPMNQSPATQRSPATQGNAMKDEETVAKDSESMDIHSLEDSLSVTVRIHPVEEECCRGPACWLWDYLRRSGATGFLLPLSGGADSASVATIVRVMCTMVSDAAFQGNTQVLDDVQRIYSSNSIASPILQELKAKFLAQSKAISFEEAKQIVQSSNTLTISTSQEELLSSATEDEKRLEFTNELTYQILHTIYLGTNNSSLNTQDRAKRLANSIHSYHNTFFIDEVIAAIMKVFYLLTGKTPKFQSQGGTLTEDLALQNIQARVRMVLSYLCAQLFPWIRGNKGFLLVLGSANVDEALRGYMTKYDCSSADLNPIGGIAKGDLKKMLHWVGDQHEELEVLHEIASAPPTAELRPFDESSDGKESDQLDEEDMGMTYAELGIFGKLRKISRCGPVKMYLKLLELWKELTPAEIAAKVKRFFVYYSINRHKMTTLTPAYHAEGYSPDDNRFDLRPFLYNTKWTRQFNTIDSMLANQRGKKK